MDPDIVPEKKETGLEAAFLADYEANSSLVFRHVLLRVRDRERAVDIVQETFARTWIYIADGKEVASVKAFLFRVANNLIVDTSRRRRSVSLDAMAEEDAYEPADETAKEPVDIVAVQEALRLLDGLDEIYRVAVTMRFIDSLTPKEIAEALELSENVVSVRIHRGVEKLQKMMAEHR